MHARIAIKLPDSFFSLPVFFSFTFQSVYLKMKQFYLFLLILLPLRLLLAGTYVEYKIKSQAGTAGIMKAWYQDGNTRSQMRMEMPAAGHRMAGLPDMGSMSVLLLRDQPDKTFMIDEGSGTYFEAPQWRGSGASEPEYEITVLGREEINGYSCIRIKAAGKSPGDRSEMELWVSKDVPGYRELKNFRTRQFNNASLHKAMEAKGLEGFPVKMLMNGGGRGREKALEMELVKSEIMDIPDSRFTLDGLIKKEGNPFMPAGMDPEKLKNMSPEERMKFFRQFQQQATPGKD